VKGCLASCLTVTVPQSRSSRAVRKGSLVTLVTRCNHPTPVHHAVANRQAFVSISLRKAGNTVLFLISASELLSAVTYSDAIYGTGREKFVISARGCPDVPTRRSCGPICVCCTSFCPISSSGCYCMHHTDSFSVFPSNRAHNQENMVLNAVA